MQSAAELEASIAVFTKLESILPAWDRRRIVVDMEIGTALAVRAELTQLVADLDRAILRAPDAELGYRVGHGRQERQRAGRSRGAATHAP